MIQLAQVDDDDVTIEIPTHLNVWVTGHDCFEYHHLIYIVVRLRHSKADLRIDHIFR